MNLIAFTESQSLAHFSAKMHFSNAAHGIHAVFLLELPEGSDSMSTSKAYGSCNFKSLWCSFIHCLVHLFERDTNSSLVRQDFSSPLNTCKCKTNKLK